MKSIVKTYILLIAFMLSGWSCERVIDLKLEGVQPKYVIEAQIKSDSVCVVDITRTVDFSDYSGNPYINNAVVRLSDDNQNSETLAQISDGRYRSLGMVGVCGRTYNLSVEIDGERFIAHSTMPEIIQLDSVTTVTLPGFGGGEKFYLSPNFQDPLGTGNCYKFIIYVNGQLDKRMHISHDKNYDGRYYHAMPFGTEADLVEGDKVTMEMQCIDKDVHFYFYSLGKGQSGGSASPANPISNFRGDCLGYFNACASTVIDGVVKKKMPSKPKV